MRGEGSRSRVPDLIGHVLNSIDQLLAIKDKRITLQELHSALLDLLSSLTELHRVLQIMLSQTSYEPLRRLYKAYLSLIGEAMYSIDEACRLIDGMQRSTVLDEDYLLKKLLPQLLRRADLPKLHSVLEVLKTIIE